MNLSPRGGVRAMVPDFAHFGPTTGRILTDRDAMTSTMLPAHWNWQKLFSYAEVVCFISAWAVGLLVASEGPRVDRQRHATRSFATTSDSLGVQANRLR
jgi:hypothetical protein